MGFGKNATIVGVLSIFGGAGYYTIKNAQTINTRIEANQSTVLDAVGNKAKYESTEAVINKKTGGLLNFPIRQTLKNDAWEKEADKIKNANAYAEGKEAGVDSTQEAMNKLLKEKVQAAVDSVNKAKNAVIKKVKSVGKKNTKHAKISNKKLTNTVHKTIHKAAKKLVKQTSKHIKK